MIINIKNQIISGGLDSLISNITNGDKKDLLIQDENFIYQLTTSDNQKFNIYDNLSSINLGECENLLHEYYNISENEPLLIFKIDTFEKGLLIPKVDYEIFNLKTKKQLNLTICENSKIKILMPAYIDESEEFKHNISSDYYNNICHIYTTKNGTDITLKDRKKEFNKNNMSLCESNCEYDGYNSSIKKAQCNCNVKIQIPSISEIISNQDKLIQFVDIKNIINLSIMKCYNVLFSLNGLKYNIGNYILLSIIFIIICCSIIFLFRGKKMIKNILDKIAPSKKKNLKHNNKRGIFMKKTKKKIRKKLKTKNLNIKNVIDKIKIDKIGHKKISNNPPFKKSIKRKKKLKIKSINNIETNIEEKNANNSSNYNIKNLNKKKLGLIYQNQ